MVLELSTQACERRALRPSQAVAVPAAPVVSLDRLRATDPHLLPMARRAAWPTMWRMDTSTLVVELADRHNDDLDVLLLWGRRSGRLWVDVVHRSLGHVA